MDSFYGTGSALCDSRTSLKVKYDITKSSTIRFKRSKVICKHPTEDGVLSGTPNGAEMSGKIKAVALWRAHSAVAKGTGVTHDIAFHTNRK